MSNKKKMNSCEAYVRRSKKPKLSLFLNTRALHRRTTFSCGEVLIAEAECKSFRQGLSANFEPFLECFCGLTLLFIVIIWKLMRALKHCVSLPANQLIRKIFRMNIGKIKHLSSNCADFSHKALG